MLPLSSQYIVSLLLFVFNNKDYFVSNSAFHSYVYIARQRLFTFALGNAGHVSEGNYLFRHQNL